MLLGRKFFIFECLYLPQKMDWGPGIGGDERKRREVVEEEEEETK